MVGFDPSRYLNIFANMGTGNPNQSGVDFSQFPGFNSFGATPGLTTVQGTVATGNGLKPNSGTFSGPGGVFGDSEAYLFDTPNSAAGSFGLDDFNSTWLWDGLVANNNFTVNGSTTEDNLNAMANVGWGAGNVGPADGNVYNDFGSFITFGSIDNFANTITTALNLIP